MKKRFGGDEFQELERSFDDDGGLLAALAASCDAIGTADC